MSLKILTDMQAQYTNENTFFKYYIMINMLNSCKCISIFKLTTLI
jgi:hypothetical protein